MNNLPKYGLPKVKPVPKKRFKFINFFRQVHLIEIPVFFTLGIVVIGHIAYGMYVFSDEGNPKNIGMIYVPFRSEYTNFVSGLKVLRRRFEALKSKDDSK